uniref:Uncharacterized protein n=1 Tax=Chenopodium quinoa TaxID=63459 RepID=A0A803MD48_CHEQI
MGELSTFEGHSRKKCGVKKTVAKRRLKSWVVALERQGMSVLYSPREYNYYSNLIRGLPNKDRYKNPEANLVRPEEPEDMRMEDRNLSGDGDSDFEDSSDNSESGDSDSYFTSSGNFSDSSEQGGEIISRVVSPPRTRLGLSRDLYAQFFFCSNLREVFSSCGPCLEGQIQEASLDLIENRPRSPPPTFNSIGFVQKSSFRPSKSSTFEVGESSSKPTLFYGRHVCTRGDSLPGLSIIAHPPASFPQPSLKLLNLMPEPTFTIISPANYKITDTTNCFIQAGMDALAHTHPIFSQQDLLVTHIIPKVDWEDQMSCELVGKKWRIRWHLRHLAFRLPFLGPQAFVAKWILQDIVFHNGRDFHAWMTKDMMVYFDGFPLLFKEQEN